MQPRGYQFENADRRVTPGVYFEETAPRRAVEFRTGVPAFLGFAHPSGANLEMQSACFSQTRALTAWNQFDELIGATPVRGFLRDAVRGFFENGGTQCVVIPLPFDVESPTFGALTKVDLKCAFDALEAHEEVDLICCPDFGLAGDRMLELQEEVLGYCNGKTGRFAILDSQPCAPAGRTEEGATGTNDVERLVNHWRELPPSEGALYFPWLRVNSGVQRWVPPCGHVAGIYSRTDRKYGVHKAPANEVVEGAVDLEVQLADGPQGRLNDAGVNCLRSLPGRGIRVWGARTLSGLPDWRYVNVRRTFLTLVRWIDQSFGDLVFEPQSAALWERIHSRLNGFCYEMFQAGALNGLSPREAFYVKCDAETNPPEERESGWVVAQVGLAPIAPAEFIVVRIAHSATGTMLVTPAQLQDRR